MRVLLGLTIASAVFAAQTPVHAAEIDKIAYVDVTRALNEVEEGKAAKAKLKAEFAAKQDRLDKMQKDFMKKREQFDSRRTMMKPEVRLQKQEELQKEAAQLQQTFMQVQQELMGSEAKVTQTIGRKLRKIITKIGDRDSYSLIVNIGDTVLYYKRHRDITDQVVREYNRHYGKK